MTRWSRGIVKLTRWTYKTYLRWPKRELESAESPLTCVAQLIKCNRLGIQIIPILLPKVTIHTLSRCLFFYLRWPKRDLDSAERPLISRFRCWNGSNRSSAVLFVYPMPEKKELGNASTLGHVVPYTNRVNVRKEMSSITIGAIWS